MPPRLRKAVLSTHVATSVGWLGAVVAYITLDLTAVTSRDVELVRGAYVAMELIVGYAIVPLALASVAVGIVNAVGTSWGLFQHYWVLVKLLLTLVATGVLLLETRTVHSLADSAATAVDPRDLPGSLPHSIGGLLLLLLILFLSIYKPRGLTRYGWRKQGEQRRQRTQAAVIER
ncbi:DUF2269 domain-containing protein [Blastococcus sp. CT_GayMR16]|nr:DUF2269 domain-containing protein [Blastococcus sp. CT_GayMR16]